MVAQVIAGQSPKGTALTTDSNDTEFHQGKTFFGRQYIQNSGAYTNEPTKIAPKESILLSVRAPVGAVNLTDRKICIGRGLFAIVPNDQLLVKFLYFVLLTKARELQSKSTGTTFKAVTGKVVRDLYVPVPPLKEQARIVDKVSDALEEIDRAEKAYEELQTLAGVLRGQILQEAIQGKLVPQLAEEGVAEQIGVAPDEVPFEIPESWKWCHMKGITQKIHYGFTASAANAGNAKLLRITDIQDGRVNWDTVPFCDVPEKKLASCKLGESDVVIARTGGTIGKSFLLTDVSDVAVFASYLIRLIPCAEVVNPKYLMVFLNSPEYWKQLKAMSQGTGQPNVNAKSLSTLLLPLPPLDEQARIVAKVEELLKHVDALSAK